MKSLEEEAEQYEKSFGDGATGTESIDFIAGANSNWVQAEKIKVQIEENDSVLQMLFLHGNESSRIRVIQRIESLKQQLKQLEDEKDL